MSEDVISLSMVSYESGQCCRKVNMKYTQSVVDRWVLRKDVLNAMYRHWHIFHLVLVDAHPELNIIPILLYFLLQYCNLKIFQHFHKWLTKEHPQVVSTNSALRCSRGYLSILYISARSTAQPGSPNRNVQSDGQVSSFVWVPQRPIEWSFCGKWS